MAQVLVRASADQGVVLLKRDLPAPVAAQVIACPERQCQAGDRKQDPGGPHGGQGRDKAPAQEAPGEPFAEQEYGSQGQHRVAGEAGEEAFSLAGFAGSERTQKPVGGEDQPQPGFNVKSLPCLQALFLSCPKKLIYLSG